ncbi:phage tail spike protein [Pseudolactococcus piscium]|uniref:Peptidase S74 domain-containing protein n=1 Tax=Pseudolactococcus piscium MKFS47 TaxID=297352 RepID=A0A0D6DVJ1_9LACT|nr:phage tail spike protein [Lactococcus piscium]CEN27973.1 Uncharacterized protein LACPI_0773 [Lactococcus piscium MKFS47]
MSYPILYQAGETNFNHLGLGILKDTISAVVSEDLNGKFELDLVYAYNNRLSKSLVSGNIIKVDAGNILKEQLFTIGQVSKTLDGKISVHAEHVSYIMQDLTLKPKTVVYQQDAQNALKQLLSAIKETDHGFTVVSDISTISSSTWSVPDFKTPRDVLAGVDGSVLDNWGGEYKFDNRRISLLEQRGSYANTVIAYGRNLLDFEQETSILETYTSIYPIVVKTEKDVEVTHTLPELAVDSQYLDKYANRKSFLVDFSDKFDDKNPYSDDKLRTLANAYIKANKVGIPKVTMTIKTLDLAKMVTDDYKAGRVERLDLADTVKVYFDRLGITTEAKVVGIKWNVLKESYDEYVLGERKATFGTVIRGSIAEVKAVADSAKKDAITALISADNKATNYYGNSSDGEPPNPKKGDIWFVKDGDKTSIKTWNGTSWVDLVSSDWQKIFEEKLAEELAKSKKELDEALAEKDAALKDLDTKIAAKMTVIDQSIAQGKLDTATAQIRADEAVAKASANVIDLQAAKIDINKALNDSASAINDIKLVDGKVNSATSTIADIKLDMNGKADKTTVASQISQSATQVKVDLQSWTNGKLTDYSTIQATSNSIALATADKATKAQVTILSNQITSTVTGLTNESIVTVDMIKDAKTKHPDYPDMIVLGIPATSGETYIVSTNKPNRGTESAPIADVFYTQAWDAPPSSPSNGAWSGHSVTTKAVINRIYLVFRDANFLSSFVNGDYWVKLIAAPASQSQITQLVDDINIRVKNSEIVNQINLSKEGILIAGSKVQITGQTYIENGVITSAKIQDLSASKLTAGTINGSVINVININAGNITTGTLSADRIAANSITATHISISSLSALSANLGTVTAGTINAATVNIININANSITTGTLNADRIGANSITADKIKATSLDLFNNDAYTDIKSDGMRLQSKAHIIFGPWIDVNGSRRSTQGLYMGGFGGGVKHIAFTRSDGTAFMLRAENGMDYGANQNVTIGDLNLYDNVQFWESARIHGNLINEGYIALGGSVQEASVQYDKPAGTMNFRVPGGRSGSYFWFNQRAISEGSFESKSKLSLKIVKGDYQGNALDEICSTNIVEYSYKNDPDRRQLSPIIDDINKIKKYHLPDIINDGEAVNLYAMGSLSWLAIKQLAQKLEKIEEKLDAIA